MKAPNSVCVGVCFLSRGLGGRLREGCGVPRELWVRPRKISQIHQHKDAWSSSASTPPASSQSWARGLLSSERSWKDFVVKVSKCTGIVRINDGVCRVMAGLCRHPTYSAIIYASLWPAGGCVLKSWIFYVHSRRDVEEVGNRAKSSVELFLRLPGGFKPHLLLRLLTQQLRVWRHNAL